MELVCCNCGYTAPSSPLASPAIGQLKTHRKYEKFFRRCSSESKARKPVSVRAQRSDSLVQVEKPLSTSISSALEQLDIERGVCIPFRKYTPESVRNNVLESRGSILSLIGRGVEILWGLGLYWSALMYDCFVGRDEEVVPFRARQLRNLLCDLGPSFIKAGQVLANRPDIIREDYMNELCILQDDVPPFPNQVAFDIIEEELGQPLEAVFSKISSETIAAASLGQVYRATLRSSGEDVAIKVQRPEIEPIIYRDLFLFRTLASFLNGISLQKLGCNAELIVDEFGEKLLEELDYTLEARNIEDFIENFKGDPTVKIPRVYKELSGSRVLVMEWIDGIRCTDPQAIKNEGIDVDGFLTVGVSAALRQLLEFGLFHGDPHPGNIFAMRDGRIAYVDFGNVAVLSQVAIFAILTALNHFNMFVLVSDWTRVLYNVKSNVQNHCCRTSTNTYLFSLYIFFSVKIVVSADCFCNISNENNWLISFRLIVTAEVEQNKQILIDAVVHAVNEDYAEMANDFTRLGFLASGTDVSPIIPALEAIWQNSVGKGLSDFNFRSVTGKFNQLVYNYPIRIPERFSLVIRSLLTQEGICFTLKPDFKFLEVAYPYVAKRLLTDPNPALRERLIQVCFVKDGVFQWKRLENLIILAKENVAKMSSNPALQKNNMYVIFLSLQSSRELQIARKLDLTDTIKDGTRLFLIDEGIRRQLLLALTEDSKLHIQELVDVYRLLEDQIDVPSVALQVARDLPSVARDVMLSWSASVLSDR
ncbi:protein kinase superfamily protein [Striga asiatica]|uniref:Protein kinase superfamily protein n=1 Tax=Striga asiatica TaxID=4170 RepID=A0A5A7Q3C7_STRAF|nr:protein kinase superfamily protein [Striga asiatica]